MEVLLNLEEAQKIVDEIEMLCEGGGSYELLSLQAVHRIVSLLRLSLADTLPIGGKLSSVESWATILFSDRSHVDWGGVSTVRSYIKRDCAALRSILRDAGAKEA